MKKKDCKWKKSFFFLLCLLVLGTAVLGGCKKKEKVTDETTSDTELLLSFDTYEEITMTGIRLGNQFGKTEINQDKQYLTEGKGSWKIIPQGDYGQEDKYPYVQMQCLKSDYEDGFLSSDFFEFDKVMLDVYSDSDEEIQIKWSFTIANANDNFVETDENTYTLKPKSWNTCEFDMSDEAYSCSYNLKTVKYMKITFLTKKDSKEDIVSALYLDNFRGHIAKEQRVQKELKYDMTEGLTFENTTDQYVVNGKNVSGVKRISYKEMGIAPLNDAQGEYALVGDGTGSVWPGFVVNYDKTYEADKVLSFMMYVEANPDAVVNHKVSLESKKETLGKWDWVMLSSDNFNEWIEVKIILSADDNNDYFFVNLDNNSSGTSFVPSGESVKIYLDNICISDKEQEVIENEDGSVILLNPYNKKTLVYTYDLPVAAGQNVAFDIDIEPAQHIAVWVMGEGFIQDERWEDEYFAREYFTWNGKQTIRVKFPEDSKNFKIMIMFMDESIDWTKNRVTISNTKVFDFNYNMRTGLTFENTTDVYAVGGSGASNIKRISYSEAGIAPLNDSQGQYALVGIGTGNAWPGFVVDYEKTYSKDQVLSFQMYVEVDENAIAGKSLKVECKNDTLWNEVTLSSEKFNKWVEVKNILISDTDHSNFFLNFDNGNGVSYLGDTPVKIYLDNIRISDKEQEVLKNADGSVTLLNPYNRSELTYNTGKSAKAGQTFSFDLELSAGATAAVWVLGDGRWDEYEFSATDNVTGKTTITSKVKKNVKDIQIYLKYKGGESDRTGYAATIRNIKVFDFNYDMSKGLTFEKDMDRYAVSGNSVIDVKRITYNKAGISPKNDSMGQYALVGNATGSTWPGFTVTYDKVYGAGKELSFMMYVQTDANAVKDYTVNLECKNGKLWNDVILSSNQFNQWIEVHAILGSDTGESNFFVNFDNGNGRSYLGNTPVKIYIDNICIGEKAKEVVKNGDTVTLLNPYNRSELTYNIGKSAKAGQIFSFDLELSAGATAAVWVLGDGKWDEYEFSATDNVTGKTTITSKVNKNVKDIQIYLKYKGGESDRTGYSAKIRNIKVFDYNYNMSEGLTFEQETDRYAIGGNLVTDVEQITYNKAGISPKNESMGQYALVGNATGSAWPGFTVTYDKIYEAGKELSFMMYVQTDANAVTEHTVNVECKNGTLWNDVMLSSNQFNQWIEVHAIFGSDTGESNFFLNFDNGNGESYLGDATVKIYVDNIRIGEKANEVVKNGDTVTLLNPYNRKELTYYLGQGAKAGQVISLDLELSQGAKAAVWLLGDGAWGDYEFSATDNLTGKTTIVAKAKKDVTDIQLYLKYKDDYADRTGYSATITNVNIADEEVADVSRGLGFEQEVDQTVISGSWENPAISRVSYETAGITPAKDSQGAYALQVDGTGKIWPGISVDYGKTFQKDMMLSFMLYIQVDPNSTDGKWVRLEGKSGGSYDWVRQSEWGFNQWIEVKTILSADASSSEFFINLDDGSGSSSWFGDKDVKIYVDNIRVSEADKEVVENPDGSVTLRNPYWDRGDLIYNIQRSAAAGSTISFDIEFAGDAKGGVWVLGDGKWGAPYECFAQSSISGKQTITTTLNADVEFIQIYIGNFVQATDGSEYEVTISNIQVSEGNVTMQRTAGNKAIAKTWLWNVASVFQLDKLVLGIKNVL